MNELTHIRRQLAKSLPNFSALGDPIRQQLILLILDGRRRTVAELAAEIGLARPTISHHLRVLKDVGILRSKKVGVHVYYLPDHGMYLDNLRDLNDHIDALKNHKKGME